MKRAQKNMCSTESVNCKLRNNILKTSSNRWFNWGIGLWAKRGLVLGKLVWITLFRTSENAPMLKMSTRVVKILKYLIMYVLLSSYMYIFRARPKPKAYFSACATLSSKILRRKQLLQARIRDYLQINSQSSEIQRNIWLHSHQK